MFAILSSHPKSVPNFVQVLSLRSLLFPVEITRLLPPVAARPPKSMLYLLLLVAARPRILHQYTLLPSDYLFSLHIALA